LQEHPLFVEYFEVFKTHFTGQGRAEAGPLAMTDALKKLCNWTKGGDIEDISGSF